MHTQSRRRIDLDHAPAGVADRAADVRRQKIHPGDVQAEGQGGPPGDGGVGRVNLVGPVCRGPSRGKVGRGSQQDPDAGPRNALRRQALAGQEGQRLLVETDQGQAVLMADAPARIGVDLFDQFSHRPAPVALDAGRAALGDGDDPAVDYQDTIIPARKLLLDDDPSSVGRSQGEGLPDGLGRIQTCRDAPSVVAVEGLDHDPSAQAGGGGGGLIRSAHHFPAGCRTAHGLKQGLGLGLVARQFGRDQARAVRHAGAQAPLPGAPSQPQETSGIEAFDRNPPASRGVDQRLCGGAQRRPAHRIAENGGRFIGVDGARQARIQTVRADPVQAADPGERLRQQGVAKLQGQSSGQKSRGFVAIGEEDVVDAGLAAHRTRLAPRDRGSRAGLQFKGDVLRHVAEPGPVAQTTDKSARLAIAASVPIQTGKRLQQAR